MSIIIRSCSNRTRFIPLYYVRIGYFHAHLHEILLITFTEIKGAILVIYVCIVFTIRDVAVVWECLEMFLFCSYCYYGSVTTTLSAHIDTYLTDRSGTDRVLRRMFHGSTPAINVMKGLKTHKLYRC